MYDINMLRETDKNENRGMGGGKNALFLGCLSRNILDKEAPDMHFSQCLQGFRV